MAQGRNISVTDDSARTLGIIGLVCGVIGFLISFGLGILGMPFSIAAIVLGVISRRREASGMATAAIVLGAVTIVLVVVVIALATGGAINNPG